MTSVSFSGKQPNYTAYVKTFAESTILTNTNITWTNTTLNNQSVLTPSNSTTSVYIKNDLIVGGSINNPSDLKLKENIEELNLSLCNDLLKLEPKQYTYKADINKKIRYGLIAQELEGFFPNLVTNVIIEEEGEIEEHKVVNYIELIPFLIVKIKDLQNQLDELKHGKPL
jgi:hypothetical protein